MEETAKSEPKYKVHTFQNSVTWTGDRTWNVHLESAPDILGSAPPIFQGTGDRWSAEDLLLAGVNTCHLSTFVAYTLRKGFEFVSFESSIEGTLEHTDRGYVYTRMIVRPKVVVKSETDIDQAMEYLEKAHKFCFMANSVSAEVLMEPEVMVSQEQ